LRKLPFQAHSFFVRAPTATVRTFFHALRSAAQREHASRAAMQEQ
jgi:hypothetical protein